ncbi:MAG: Glyoxalase/bleomycin resistance protein/dioxygenase [Ilumatobacteraceae bacterium]|nr:Glyoxalase/bleomycin resistance protein/dioxygenase [Ilumatobacteraceae bacterium]
MFPLQEFVGEVVWTSRRHCKTSPPTGSRVVCQRVERAEIEHCVPALGTDRSQARVLPRHTRHSRCGSRSLRETTPQTKDKGDNVSTVVGLGYLIVNTTDVEAWREYACDVFGLQGVELGPDRLLLRMDDKSYRLDVRKSEVNGFQAVGWEVSSAADLEALAGTLEADGIAVTREGVEAAQDRQVSGLVRFSDPDGQVVELFYGLKKDKNRFVSPTGARFSTGTNGLGHVFQLVADEEAFRHLYLDLLGFRLSDYIDFAPGFTGTFTHCNPRHHSFAYAAAPPPARGINHIMFEVEELDSVGRAYDCVLGGKAVLTSSFGKHSNDEMLSFYSQTPSGFALEYGTAGVLIDDATWTPARYDVPSYWGHSRSGG